jgi:hypothetical protein
MANWKVAKFAFLKLQFDAAQRAEKVGKFAYDASSFFCRTHSLTRQLSREGKHVTRRKVRRARKLVKTALNFVHTLHTGANALIHAQTKRMTSFREVENNVTDIDVSRKPPK